MKNITILFITALMAMSSIIFSQSNEIPNAGFEEWVNDLPVNWATSNTPSFTNITQSSEAHSGLSSLKSEIVDFNNHPLGGLLQSGMAPPAPPLAHPFPISHNYQRVVGYFKCVTQSQADGILFDFILSDSSFQAVAVAQQFIPCAPDWTEFSIDFQYIPGNDKQARNLAVQIANATDTGSNAEPIVGTYFLLDDLALEGTAVGIEPITNSEIPGSFQLKQNYPNPFNPSTIIEFAIPTSERVRLIVYNQLGQEVARLADEQLAAGRYQFVWDAGNLPSGVYFYRLTAGAFSESKKFILMK